MRIFLAAITDSFALGFCENLSSAAQVFQKLILSEFFGTAILAALSKKNGRTT
jgi:hypothetical protein